MPRDALNGLALVSGLVEVAVKQVLVVGVVARELLLNVLAGDGRALALDEGAAGNAEVLLGVYALVPGLHGLAGRGNFLAGRVLKEAGKAELVHGIVAESLGRDVGALSWGLDTLLGDVEALESEPLLGVLALFGGRYLLARGRGRDLEAAPVLVPLAATIGHVNSGVLLVSVAQPLVLEVLALHRDDAFGLGMVPDAVVLGLQELHRLVAGYPVVDTRAGCGGVNTLAVLGVPVALNVELLLGLLAGVPLLDLTTLRDGLDGDAGAKGQRKKHEEDLGPHPDDRFVNCNELDN